MSAYYGFISKENDRFKLIVEHGSLTDSVYDYSTVIDKKLNLTKEQVNHLINEDALGTVYIYKGISISKLF